jgi:hypothetical protein
VAIGFPIATFYIWSTSSCPILIGHLLFALLKLFDLLKDFAGLSHNLAVDAETDDASYDTADSGASAEAYRHGRVYA